MPSKPTSDQVCGRCAEFEAARNEPANDVRYGYCKPREALEREQHGRPAGRLVGFDTPCFMPRSPAGVPAFVPKR